MPKITVIPFGSFTSLNDKCVSCPLETCFQRSQQLQGGASPYMTLGGVLVRDSNAHGIEQFLTGLVSELGIKTLHCADMNHRKKVHYAKSVAAQPFFCFGVISFKQTLEEYKEDIGDEYWRYYHKCAQYLLERLGLYLQEHDIPNDAVRIVFEASNLIRLPQFQRFITACQKNPVRKQTALLSRISKDNISTETKSDALLLCLGDLTAHALYQCVNKAQHNYGNLETRYAYELRSRFFASPQTNKILNWGIMPIHTIEDLQLDKDVHDFLCNLQFND